MSYPDELDTLATNKTNATLARDDHPAHHNALANSIKRVQQTLGLNPEGDEDTVAARLAGMAGGGGVFDPVYRKIAYNTAGLATTGVVVATLNEGDCILGVPSGKVLMQFIETIAWDGDTPTLHLTTGQSFEDDSFCNWSLANPALPVTELGGELVRATLDIDSGLLRSFVATEETDLVLVVKNGGIYSAGEDPASTQGEGYFLCPIFRAGA